MLQVKLCYLCCQPALGNNGEGAGCSRCCGGSHFSYCFYGAIRNPCALGLKWESTQLLVLLVRPSMPLASILPFRGWKGVATLSSQQAPVSCGGGRDVLFASILVCCFLLHNCFCQWFLVIFNVHVVILPVTWTCSWLFQVYGHILKFVISNFSNDAIL